MIFYFYVYLIVQFLDWMHDLAEGLAPDMFSLILKSLMKYNLYPFSTEPMTTAQVLQKRFKEFKYYEGAPTFHISEEECKMEGKGIQVCPFIFRI